LVCLAAVQADVLNFLHVPEKYRTDELIISVLQEHGGLLYDVAEERRTPEMYMTAIENYGRALKFFPEEMITPEIAMKAVQLDGTALEFVPESVNTPEICRAALNCKDSDDYDVIHYVPFSDVCYDYLKNSDGQTSDPFMVFGNVKRDVVTTEMAQLAVKLEPSCLQFVPDRLKTSELCAEAVGKDWMNMRFVPENRKTKTLCDIAISGSIHAQQFVPERFKTPEMYMDAMKINGINLYYVPDRYKTPEVCLQAVMSNRHAKKFLPERTNSEFNIYDFYQKFKNESIIAEYLSFEHIHKAFHGETVHVSGIRFAKNVTLKDFTIDFDRNTHRVNVKALDEAPEKKHIVKFESEPKKKRGVKM